MRQHRPLYRLDDFYRGFFLACLMMVAIGMNSCGSDSPQTSEESPSEVAVPSREPASNENGEERERPSPPRPATEGTWAEEEVYESDGPVMESPPAAHIPPPVIHTPDMESPPEEEPIQLEDYKAILEVDRNIKHHQTANLKVWIGLDSVTYEFDPEKESDTEAIPARLGQYATVKPIAPDFDIDPEIIGCIKIDPSGSSIQFSLKPKSEGVFKVSAEIQLYNAAHCQGTPVPKTTQTLTVMVEVDKGYKWKSRIGQMGDIFWDKFFSFWGVLITLLLGFVIYLVRRFLKRKTGYEGRDG